MAFALRYGGSRIPLPNEGRFSIGRSSDCDLTIDDLLASRMHVLLHVHSREVVLEDTGSRNGTQHNGRLVVERVQLAVGDRFSIGNQELELVVDREQRVTQTTAIQIPMERPTMEITVGNREQELLDTGLSHPDRGLIADARSAIGAGDTAEASALGALLARRMENAAKRGGYVEPGLVGDITELLVELAVDADDWSWVERAFDVNRVHGQVLAGRVIDALLELARRIGPRSKTFQPYYDALAARSELSIEQRVRVRRLEVLGRALGG